MGNQYNLGNTSTFANELTKVKTKKRRTNNVYLFQLIFFSARKASYRSPSECLTMKLNTLLDSFWIDTSV